jgi:hypothetical protein
MLHKQFQMVGSWWMRCRWLGCRRPGSMWAGCRCQGADPVYQALGGLATRTHKYHCWITMHEGHSYCCVFKLARHEGTVCVFQRIVRELRRIGDLSRHSTTPKKLVLVKIWPVWPETWEGCHCCSTRISIRFLWRLFQKDEMPPCLLRIVV